MSSTPKHTNARGNKSGRVYLIDASGGRLLSVIPDRSDLKVLVTDRHRIPDGIVVDVEKGHIYWTEMGIPNKEDNSIDAQTLTAAITSRCDSGKSFKATTTFANIRATRTEPTRTYRMSPTRAVAITYF